MHRGARQTAFERAICRFRTICWVAGGLQSYNRAFVIILAGSLICGALLIAHTSTASGAAAILPAAQSVSELMRERSPGSRAGADLISTKRVASGKVQRLARQNHLGSSRSASMPISQLAEAIETSDFAPAPPVDEQQFLFTDLVGGGTGAVDKASLVDVSASGAAGSMPPASASRAEQVMLAPAAVPEPDTWSTLLIGFSLLAWRVRSCSLTKTKPARGILKRG